VNNGKINYLTIPIKKKGLRHQLINECKIDDIKIFEEHLKKIRHAYSKTKYFKEYYNKIEKIIIDSSNMNILSDINIYIIKEISKIIGLNCNFSKSSELKCSGKKSIKLINICNKLNCKDYLFNPGALDYIKEDLKEFKKNSINLYIISYNQKTYSQKNFNFVADLSILDLLFNLGIKTKDYIKKNYSIKKF
tara:strand:- start:42 stop:617 length:576 start_codon:yes stop_codon:yes gene_type:complete